MIARKNPKNTKLQDDYINYRNHCNNVLQNLKILNDRSLLTESKGNTKNTWKAIKKICNIDSNRPSNTALLQNAKTPIQSLNSVNNFFAAVGDRLASTILNKINKTEIDLVDTIKPSSITPIHSLFLTPTNDGEIVKIISSLKPGSAPGHDGLNNDLIKGAKYALASPLAYLCNLSLSSGVVPDCLKVANVIPILKSGSPTDPTNYRPISLLTSVSKIIEKIVNVRLLTFLEYGNLLADNQFGFRKGRSTEDAVAHMVDHISEKLDSSQKCIGVFLDLAKAFDTVSRPMLFRKMECLGIRGVALQWFKSYFENRRQRICVSDNMSDFTEVSFGVPQGSVLGPTLFLIYVDDLCRLKLTQAKTLAFADDTALMFHGKTWTEAMDLARKGLATVHDWLQNNLLTLNVAKTKYITFSISQRTAPNIPISIKIHDCHPNRYQCNCPELERVQSTKYLGVHLDDHLSWKHHILALTGKIRKLKYIFKKLNTVRDIETIKLVYTALCQSLLSYCIVIWGSACATTFLKLERAQRAVLKISLGKPFRYSTDCLFQDCQFLRVRQIFIKTTVLRFHKRSLLSARTSVRSRRNAIWPTPTTRTIFGQKAPSFLGPFLYSRAHKELDLKQCLKSLCKRKVEEWLRNLNYSDTEQLLHPLK